MGLQRSLFEQLDEDLSGSVDPKANQWPTRRSDAMH
jgi:hypothetical protein